MAKLKRKNKSGVAVQQTDKESHKPKPKSIASMEDLDLSVDAGSGVALEDIARLARNPAQEVCGYDVSKPGPTVEISSIFTGLQLSNKVAQDEAPESPYMQKGRAGKIICS